MCRPEGPASTGMLRFMPATDQRRIALFAMSPRAQWQSHRDLTIDVGTASASPAGMPRTFSAEAVNELTSTIIAGAIRIHRELGPGLLENAYLACLCHELAKARLEYEVQKAVPLVYDGVRIDCAFRADLVVEHAVVVEVKALDTIAPVHIRQLHTYTRLTECHVGLLLNFGAATMKDGIRRVINGFPDR
jgi:GxxExxY protein